MVVLAGIRPAAVVATLLALLAAGACFLAGGGGEEIGPHFSHLDHGEEQGLHCITCHTGAYAEDRAGLPGPQLCTPCHDRFDAEKPPERRLAAFYDESGRYRATGVAALSAELRFSHRNHAEHGVACADCHGEIDRSDTIPAASAVGKDECLTCHARTGAPDRCDTCHREISASWVPPTHELAWDQRHGQVIRARDAALMNRCAMCHNESSCQICHRETPPSDHTNFWRRRGHALMVSIDRSRCATCHQTDFCDRCHESTRPVSHTASFGEPMNRHCNSCHFPVSGCATCHRGAPSHNQANPLPPGHHPAMNCRQCHGAGAPLPHPDGGHACTACHR